MVSPTLAKQRVGGDYIVDGANRVLNVLYQRCDASQIEITDDRPLPGFNKDRMTQAELNQERLEHLSPDEFYDLSTLTVPGNHPYLDNHYAKGCRDMRKMPPIYHLGGRPSFMKNEGGAYEINLFHRNWRDSGGKMAKSSFVSLDCTGFVSATFAAVGLKFRTKGPEWTQLQTTTAMLAAVGSGPPKEEDCLIRSTFSSDSQLKNGDLLLFRENAKIPGHAVIISDAGPDPFGVKDLASLSECQMENIDPRRFDFKVIQAGGLSQRVAGSRAPIELFMKFSLAPMVMELALVACKSRFEARTAETASSGSGPFARVLRHVGPKKPGCVYDQTPTLKGEECLQNCSGAKSKKGAT